MKPGRGALTPSASGFFRWNGHRLHQAQAELPRVLRRVAIDELLQMRGHVGQLQIAAMLDFAGDILGNIFGPALRRVEGDDLDRLAILARRSGPG